MGVLNYLFLNGNLLGLLNEKRDWLPRDESEEQAMKQYIRPGIETRGSSMGVLFPPAPHPEKNFNKSLADL